MSILPVVERELRVAARRKGTYWTRVGVASIGLLVFGGILLIHRAMQSVLGFGLGPTLFTVFSWMAFAFVCAAGTFFTSDAISEEKRDGTLGLLFLTDLRGHDVVLGKLLAHSLRCVLGLLAAFPIMGISFLLGGVTGAEFVRLALALLNTLFFMLAAGILVSSLSHESGRAMAGTAILCLLFLGLLPTLDWWWAGWDATLYRPRLGYASPGFTFFEFKSSRPADFWRSLAVTHGLCWCFLGVASLCTPRLWRERSFRDDRQRRWRWPRPVAARSRWRARLLDGNPVRWLAARDAWTGRFVLLTLLAGGLTYGGFWPSFASPQSALSVAHGMLSLLNLLVFLWLASAATRFFVEAGRSGALELMLATPLPPRDIVLGQAWALRRNFLIPVAILMIGNTALQVIQLNQFLEQQAATLATQTAKATAGTAIDPDWRHQMIVHHAIGIAQGIATSLTGFLAYSWFGMWMGLTTRKANAAVIKTVLFVSVLPWFALTVLQILLQVAVFSGRPWSGQLPFWLPTAIAGCLWIAVQVALWWIARHRVLVHLRDLFARASGLGARPRPAPPPLPIPTTMAHP